MFEATCGEQDLSVSDLKIHYQTLVPFLKMIWRLFASCLSFSWLLFGWKLSNVSLPKDPFCEHDQKFPNDQFKQRLDRMDVLGRRT